MDDWIKLWDKSKSSSCLMKLEPWIPLRCHLRQTSTSSHWLGTVGRNLALFRIWFRDYLQGPSACGKWVAILGFSWERDWDTGQARRHMGYTRVFRSRMEGTSMLQGYSDTTLALELYARLEEALLCLQNSDLSIWPILLLPLPSLHCCLCLMSQTLSRYQLFPENLYLLRFSNPLSSFSETSLV